MMAIALAHNGAQKIYIVGRRQEVLEAWAKESPHNNIIPITGDATSRESLHHSCTSRDEVGYTNVLIANSGIGRPQEGSSATRPDVSIEEFHSKL